MKSTVSFNAELHVKELSERFSRLIKNLGMNNRRIFSISKLKFFDEGSERYRFEVDFSHAMHELENCPPYMKGKMFDRASGVVNGLINALKDQRDVTAEDPA